MKTTAEELYQDIIAPDISHRQFMALWGHNLNITMTPLSFRILMAFAHQAKLMYNGKLVGITQYDEHATFQKRYRFGINSYANKFRHHIDDIGPCIDIIAHPGISHSATPPLEHRTIRPGWWGFRINLTHLYQGRSQ